MVQEETLKEKFNILVNMNFLFLVEIYVFFFFFFTAVCARLFPGCQATRGDSMKVSSGPGQATDSKLMKPYVVLMLRSCLD